MDSVGLLIFGARDEAAMGPLRQPKIFAGNLFDGIKEWFGKHF